MKFVFLIIVLLLSAVSGAVAQTEKCALTTVAAPILLNLRLGISPDQARAIFGGKLKIKVKKEGTFFQNYIERKPPSPLEGVRALYLRFFEAKLYQIEIFYETQTPKRSLAELTERFSAELNLPPNLWTNRFDRAALDCPEFSLAADNVLNPRVELTDEMIRARFEDAQKRKKK